MSNSGPETTGASLTERLRKTTAELVELEQRVKLGDLDPRVLNEFRDAVDQIRSTAWAVQQWIGLRENAGDPYKVLPILAAQRVRRATQLAKDLTIDVESIEIGIQTPGLKELFHAVDGLHERLVPLCKPNT